MCIYTNLKTQQGNLLSWRDRRAEINLGVLSMSRFAPPKRSALEEVISFGVSQGVQTDIRGFF